MECLELVVPRSQATVPDAGATPAAAWAVWLRWGGTGKVWRVVFLVILSSERPKKLDYSCQMTLAE